MYLVTILKAVVITAPNFSFKSNLAANRWMYSDGSTIGSFKFKLLENWRKDFPRT